MVRPFFFRSVLFSLLLAFPFAPAGVLAQEKPVEVIKERTIYVPYEKLRKTFETEGRGVFLPYEQFRALSEAAEKAARTDRQAERPPVAAMIADSVNELTVQGDIVEVAAKLRIVLLQDGWHQIPLRLQDAAIRKATINGEPAKIVGSPREGYILLVERKKTGKTTDPPKNAESAEPVDTSTQDKIEPDAPASQVAGDAQSVELDLVYAKQIAKTPGRNDVALAAPLAPISRWKVVVPESGIKVDFAPLVAASEDEANKEKDAKQTVVHAYVGSAEFVRIGWTPKSEGGTGLDALINAQMDQRVQIDEGVMRTTAKIDYAISRSQIEKLAVQVPGDQKVVGLFDANVRTWSISQGDGVQTVNIELFEPAKSTQSVQLELERIFKRESAGTPTVPDAGGERLVLPVIVPLGIGRLQGVLVARAGEGLALDAHRTTGLMQMDPSELSEAVRNAVPGGWAFIYRLSTTKYAAEMSLREIRPEIAAESQISVRLRDFDVPLDVRMDVLYTIEKAGVFQFQLDVPKDYQIYSAVGAPLGGASRAEVESWYAEKATEKTDEKNADAATRRYTVKLKRKAIGRVGLHIRLKLRSGGPIKPERIKETARFEIPIPRVAKSTVERSQGKLLLQAPEVFRVSPADLRGVQPISLDVLKNAGWWDGVNPDARFAYVYGEDVPALVIDVERRKPQLTVKQVQTVRIEDGVVRNQVKLHYEVKFTSIPELRVDLPESISGRIGKIEGYRESLMNPQPADLPKGYVAWAYHKDSGFSGTGTIALTWDDGLPPLDIGKSVRVAVPRLLVPKREPGDRVWGQILLSKAPSIDLSEAPDSKGLRPIDPQVDVDSGDRIADAVTALEYQSDWSLAILATRYRLEEVKRTSIECGLVQSVFLKNNEMVPTRAVYRIRSVLQRLDLSMPAGAVFDDVRINGNRITLESTDDPAATIGTTGTGVTGIARYLVPLTSVRPDVPFTLELRYTLPRRNGAIPIPDFSAETLAQDTDADRPPDARTTERAAVQLMYNIVYLPEEEIVTAYAGPWSRHYHMFNRPGMPYLGTYNQHDPAFLLREVGGETIGDFPIGGNAYVFSTLQPGGTAEGELTLRTAKSTPFAATLFLVIFVTGAALTGLAFSRRMQAVVVLLAGACVLWLFAPTFVELCTVYRAGAFAVLCIALLWFLQGARLCYKKHAAKRKAALGNTPPAPDATAVETTVDTKPEQPENTTEGGPDHA